MQCITIRAHFANEYLASGKRLLAFETQCAAGCCYLLGCDDDLWSSSCCRGGTLELPGDFEGQQLAALNWIVPTTVQSAFTDNPIYYRRSSSLLQCQGKNWLWLLLMVFEVHPNIREHMSFWSNLCTCTYGISAWSISQVINFLIEKCWKYGLIISMIAYHFWKVSSKTVKRHQYIERAER